MNESTRSAADHRVIPVSPSLLVQKIVLSVFASEAAIMLALVFLPVTSPLLVAFIDASVLTLILLPVLYLYAYRPLFEHVGSIAQAEIALKESRERYLTLFQTCPDAITFTRRRDGLLIEINYGFTQLTGYSADEVIGTTTLGLPLWCRIEDRDRMLTALQREGRVYNFEAQFRRKDGGILTASISANAVVFDGEEHILTVVRDVTDIRAAQQKIETDYAFLLAANANHQKPMLFKAIADEIQTAIGCAAIGVHAIDDAGGLLFQYHNGFHERIDQFQCPWDIETSQCPYCQNILKTISSEQSLKSEKRIRFGGSERLPGAWSGKNCQARCNHCIAAGLESIALASVQSEGRMVGLVHAADTRNDFFSGQKLEILKSAALHLGSAMDRIHAGEALKQHQQNLEQEIRLRTADLTETNRRLLHEVEERRRTETELLRQRNKLRALSAELLETEARERRQIANELHDRIGQTLAVAKIKLGLLGQSVQGAGFSNDVAGIRDFIEQAIADTRSLTFELSPPALYTLGVEVALGGLIEQISAQHAIKIELINHEHSIDMDHRCRSIAFMAVRELLLNVVKHADARNVHLTLKRSGDHLLAIVEDNGRGFDPAEAGIRSGRGGGFGLFSIEERLAPIGGRVAIESTIGQGTRAMLTLPLDCGIRHSAEAIF
ncbi:MAG: PAS domain-containing sensor histidine kinase [Desulfobacterales bacterium]